MFDPYHRWLGIPKDQRPPSYYQLLGIPAGETDADVIKEGALRQTSHVRTYQTSPHAEDCTRLLNEIALARTTLLDAAARKEYDVRLASAAGAAAATAAPNPPAPTGAPPADAAPVDLGPPRHASELSAAAPAATVSPSDAFAVPEGNAPILRALRRSGRSWWIEPACVAYVLVLIAGGAVAFHLSQRYAGDGLPGSDAKKASTRGKLAPPRVLPDGDDAK